MIGKIFKVTVNTILILLLLCGLLAALSVIPPFNNYLKVFTVQSGSMEPAIHTGSLIFTRTAESYEVGEIVTRRSADPEISVTHRIIRIEEGEGVQKFITKGDANNAEDNEVVTKEGIIGKVYLTIPYLGYPVSYSKTPQGFILIIVIPAVIIVYEELQKISNEIRRKLDYRKRVKKRKKNDEEIKKEKETLVEKMEELESDNKKD